MQNKGRFGHENLGKSLRLYLGRRRTFSCWMRTFIIVFVLIFIWIQYLFGGFFWIKDSNKNSTKYISGEIFKNINEDHHTEVINDDEGKRHNIINIEPDDALIIREKIDQYNKQQNIINEDSYGPLTNKSLVIIVQVHNRIVYLKYLIESLSKAKEINETLLVFSHDVYDNDINMLIQSITFCKVMQIFLPYSIEAHPNEFPGNDPNDCPRDIGKKKALKIKCLNAEYPDKYGHYRESKFTQIKHHWWWKANHVFNHLTVTKGYTGLVTFLEEDHYVAEDFIHLVMMMDQKCTDMVDCSFLGLGSHIILKSYKEFKDADQVRMSPLITNLGLSFNRSTFNILLDCSKQFCKYDDYNWDWTLNYISKTCGKTPLLTMIASGPRVIHTGECGTHIHKNNCEENVLILNIQDLLNRATNKLYPSAISVSDLRTKSPKITENGGWGDIRDHELCMNMTKR